MNLLDIALKDDPLPPLEYALKQIHTLVLRVFGPDTRPGAVAKVWERSGCLVDVPLKGGRIGLKFIVRGAATTAKLSRWVGGPTDPVEIHLVHDTELDNQTKSDFEGWFFHAKAVYDEHQASKARMEARAALTGSVV